MGGPGHPMTGPDTVYNAFPVLPCRPATGPGTGAATLAVCSGLAAHLRRRPDPTPHPAAHRLFVPASVPFSCRLHTALLPRVPVCPFPHCGSYSAHTKRTGRPAKFFKKSYPHSDLHLYPRAAPLCQPLCRPFLYCDDAWYKTNWSTFSSVHLRRSDHVSVLRVQNRALLPAVRSVPSLHCQVYEKAVLTCVFATIRQSGPVLGHRNTARRAGHTHRTRRHRAHHPGVCAQADTAVRRRTDPPARPGSHRTGPHEGPASRTGR